MSVALSIGIQCMVRSGSSSSGVMFPIDTESGFPTRIVLLNAAWGLGENIVQGAVNLDEYQVFKAASVQLQPGPMDMEWAKEGIVGRLLIV